MPIDGRYLMYFGEGSIYYAWSDDLMHWTPCPQDEPLMVPTAPGTFGEFLVEVGPPPIVTDNGLILLLHNAAVKNDDGTVRYTCGQLLFDPERPTEIMAQMNYPWLEPSTYEDQHGLVSNVTFVEGLVRFKDTWFAYYGQSDSTLGVATYQIGETYAAAHELADHARRTPAGSRPRATGCSSSAARPRHPTAASPGSTTPAPPTSTGRPSCGSPAG